MLKYLLFAFCSLATMGVGANLFFQIQQGPTISIVFSWISSLFILLALFFTCKLWYSGGKKDMLNQIMKQLQEKLDEH